MNAGGDAIIAEAGHVYRTMLLEVRRDFHARRAGTNLRSENLWRKRWRAGCDRKSEYLWRGRGRWRCRARESPRWGRFLARTYGSDRSSRRWLCRPLTAAAAWSQGYKPRSPGAFRWRF